MSIAVFCEVFYLLRTKITKIRRIVIIAENLLFYIGYFHLQPNIQALYL